MTNDNFAELKRAFDEECDKIYASIPKSKWTFDFNNREAKTLATAYTLAKLFDGSSILDAFMALNKAKGVIKEFQEISAECVQSSLSSFLPSLDEGD